MTRKPQADDTVVLENTAPAPAPQLACHKCGTILATPKDRYWHERGDSAGCLRSLAGMIIDLHQRLEVFEAAIAKVAAKNAEEV